jgi:hypothetical protein
MLPIEGMGRYDGRHRAVRGIEIPMSILMRVDDVIE